MVDPMCCSEKARCQIFRACLCAKELRERNERKGKQVESESGSAWTITRRLKNTGITLQPTANGNQTYFRPGYMKQLCGGIIVWGR